jgi:signal peptidase I
VEPLSSRPGGDADVPVPVPVPVVTEPAGGAGDPPGPPSAPSEPENKGGPHGFRIAAEWIGLVVLALVIALLIKTFLFQAFFIPSESMVPTLKVHDRVLVNKLSYKLHPVHRGDIVVFKAPAGSDPGIDDLVKRVIGLPNETVSARGGHVFVDNEQLPETYLPKGTITTNFSPVTLGHDQYWVMGDNRGNSKDSRVFGPIKKNEIVGRVFFRIWPFSRLGFM